MSSQAFQWAEFVDLADDLLDDPCSPSSEAHQRAAVSRAYYGAFRTARNVLENEGHSFPDSGKAHGQVQRELESDPARAKTGAQLKRLHERRKEADYNDVVGPKFDRKAESSISMAREVLDTLRNSD